MISEVGTVISTIGVLLQIRQGKDERKLKEISEYKDNLRNLVSALYFTKAVHNIAHTIIDLNCAEIFNCNIREIGFLDFKKAFEASFGQILQSKMNSEIYPNLPLYNSIILDEPRKYPVEGLSSAFTSAVNSLNYCYPKMMITYEDLHGVINDMLDKLTHQTFDNDFELKIFRNFEENKNKWKHLIDLNTKELMTYADQTLLNGITVLDFLFVV